MEWCLPWDAPMQLHVALLKQKIEWMKAQGVDEENIRMRVFRKDLSKMEAHLEEEEERKAANSLKEISEKIPEQAEEEESEPEVVSDSKFEEEKPREERDKANEPQIEEERATVTRIEEGEKSEPIEGNSEVEGWLNLEEESEEHFLSPREKEAWSLEYLGEEESEAHYLCSRAAVHVTRKTKKKNAREKRGRQSIRGESEQRGNPRQKKCSDQRKATREGAKEEEERAGEKEPEQEKQPEQPESEELVAEQPEAEQPEVEESVSEQEKKPETDPEDKDPEATKKARTHLVSRAEKETEQKKKTEPAEKEKAEPKGEPSRKGRAQTRAEPRKRKWKKSEQGRKPEEEKQKKVVEWYSLPPGFKERKKKKPREGKNKEKSDTQTKVTNRTLGCYLRCFAVYSRPPPTISAFIPGSTVVLEVDVAIRARDKTLSILRPNMQAAQANIHNWIPAKIIDEKIVQSSGTMKKNWLIQWQ